MQVTGWGTQQRAQYESFRSVFSCAAYLSSSRVFKALGNLGALQFSVSASTLYYALMAFATAGRNFYVAVPLNMFMMTGYAAMQSMLMLEGSKTGMAQGASESKTPTPLECLCNLLTKNLQL